jgi:hypothetical protein
MALVATVGSYVLYVLILYVITLFTYRLLFHPLRKYPGPFLAKITEGYLGVQAMGKFPHLNAYKNSQKYGEIITRSQMGPC